MNTHFLSIQVCFSIPPHQALTLRADESMHASKTGWPIRRRKSPIHSNGKRNEKINSFSGKWQLLVTGAPWTRRRGLSGEIGTRTRVRLAGRTSSFQSQVKSFKNNYSISLITKSCFYSGKLQAASSYQSSSRTLQRKFTLLSSGDKNKLHLFIFINIFLVRPDDVWVISFPKCGTTWTQAKNSRVFEGQIITFK